MQSNRLSFLILSDAYMTYLFQDLCNALWYATNHHSVINNVALRQSAVLSIPVCFDKYEGYNNNNIKRNKMKSLHLSSSELHCDSQALYSLLLKPVINSTPDWQILQET